LTGALGAGEGRLVKGLADGSTTADWVLDPHPIVPPSNVAANVRQIRRSAVKPHPPDPSNSLSSLPGRHLLVFSFTYLEVQI